MVESSLDMKLLRWVLEVQCFSDRNKRAVKAVSGCGNCMFVQFLGHRYCKLKGKALCLWVHSVLQLARQKQCSMMEVHLVTL